MDWDFDGFWVCPTIGSYTNLCPIKQPLDPGVFPPFSDTVSNLMALISPAMLSSCRVSAAFQWLLVTSSRFLVCDFFACELPEVLLRELQPSWHPRICVFLRTLPSSCGSLWMCVLFSGKATIVERFPELG